MSEEEWRESVRHAAMAARENPLINMTGLAKQVGWSQQALLKFCNHGVGDKEKVRRLEHILANLNLLRQDPLRPLATELRQLADLLESDVLSPADKVTKFRQFITFWNSGIETFAAMLKEKKKG